MNGWIDDVEVMGRIKDLPAAPSELSLSAAGTTQMQLNWTDNSNDEAAFHIERSPDNLFSNYIEIAAVATNQTTYTDNSVVCNTQYYYRVRAYRGDGQYSVYSIPETAMTLVCP